MSAISFGLGAGQKRPCICSLYLPVLLFWYGRKYDYLLSRWNKQRPENVAILVAWSHWVVSLIRWHNATQRSDKLEIKALFSSSCSPLLQVTRWIFMGKRLKKEKKASPWRQGQGHNCTQQSLPVMYFCFVAYSNSKFRLEASIHLSPLTWT